MFMPFNEKYCLENNKCHGNKWFGKLKKNAYTFNCLSW